MEPTVDLDTPLERGPDGDADQVAPGTRIGRYEVRTTLGKGGMGVVLLAHDDTLERYVAIKLVRARHRSSAARDRLLREAQAMAALSHPNVITVHDVGVFGDSVFVAMEHVRGANLSIWLDEVRRSPQDVLRVLTAAGRGLAAAHRVGLVHRDFKPDNVMVADDGRVLVLDFGLARPLDATQSDHAATPDHRTVSGSGSRSSSGFGSGSSSSPLTMPGWVMGTPSYMAPEQHHGRALPPSDQFAFCVTLYEALFDVRPFVGESLSELAEAKRLGHVRPPPPDIPVPASLREVIRRGLAPKPEDRFASMEALVHAIESGPRRRARVRNALAAVAMGALAIGGATSLLPGGSDLCSRSSEALVGVWDEPRREAVTEALATAPQAYAGDTTTTVLAALDRYGESIVSAQDRACRATHVERTASGEDLDHRMACLQRRKQDLLAVVDVLSAAHEGVGERAVDAVGALEPVACDTPAAGDAPRGLTPAVAIRNDDIAQIASRARALTMAGQYDSAAEVVTTLLARAEATGDAAILADAHYRHAELLQRTADHEPAAEAYLRAIDAASEAGSDRIAALAWNSLTFNTGHSRALLDRAHDYARHLDAAVLRLHSPPELEAERLTTRGILAHDGGKLAEARALLEDAVAVREGMHEQAELPALLVNLARTMAAQGEIAKARTTVERAVTKIEARYGASHPQVAKTLTYLGAIEFEGGDVASAKTRYERALEIQSVALDPRHPELAFSLNNIANAEGAQGELEAAHAHYAQALDILLERLGDEHPNVARLSFNMAELQKLMGRLDSAETEYRRTVDLFEKAFGPDHPDLGRALNNLASVQYDSEKYPESLASYSDALRVVEKALGAEHSDLAYPLTGLGLVHLAAGRPAEAIEPLERSLRLRASDDVDPVDRSDTQFALARALWDSKGDRARARTLAEQAIAGYEHAAPGLRTNRDEAVGWLAAR